MKTIAYVRASGIYNDSRATKEIKDLANAGYHIIVLGWDRNGHASKECNNVFQNCKGISFRFFEMNTQNGIGLKGIVKLLRWFIWIYYRLRAESMIDAVHACDLDTGIIASAFCKKHRIPLVYDIYDYYIDSHSIPHSIVNIVEKAEVKVINYSRVTIICTEERKEQISKASPQKLVVIHNSPEIPILSKIDNQFDYVYCGVLSDERLINQILNNYPENNDLRFCFAGYGKNEEQIKCISKEYNNFTYLGSIPYDKALDMESRTVCLSAIYDPSYRNHRLCAPNKFYESMALGKPIIVCRGTGIDRIVEDNNIGVVIDYNPLDFYKAVRFLKNTPKVSEEMGVNGRKLYEQEYRWEVMRSRLLEAYKDVFK